ncbi:hypothetical protein SAMN05443270_2474 [Lacrimispora sphenoides]|jgi:hypothetical protein|uniref:Uncharacterized protein n=1 Tax=Lacrimispora sphenoides JCM 1415 TaxID=1297793 RepID=A0ABY1CC59_9FIRM|nr:hypothetical protein K413DRAFT_5292 [Clostridium sp. ASBs410]SET91291.1 hypothetical protein SAMN02745906_2951 [[Clostridium] sphenoides JCM 1415]SET99553.1 hypothetical protein SAMN05443270_2474 [Lacrimispora sphenoides]SUY52296.1 Uncharacterised protein [Lacrimispora sphenoides]
MNAEWFGFPDSPRVSKPFYNHKVRETATNIKKRVKV